MSMNWRPSGDWNLQRHVENNTLCVVLTQGNAQDGNGKQRKLYDIGDEAPFRKNPSALAQPIETKFYALLTLIPYTPILWITKWHPLFCVPAP